MFFYGLPFEALKGECHTFTWWNTEISFLCSPKNRRIWQCFGGHFYEFFPITFSLLKVLFTFQNLSDKCLTTKTLLLSCTNLVCLIAWLRSSLMLGNRAPPFPWSVVLFQAFICRCQLSPQRSLFIQVRKDLFSSENLALTWATCQWFLAFFYF